MECKFYICASKVKAASKKHKWLRLVKIGILGLFTNLIDVLQWILIKACIGDCLTFVFCWNSNFLCGFDDFCFLLVKYILFQLQLKGIEFKAKYTNGIFKICTIHPGNKCIYILNVYSKDLFVFNVFILYFSQLWYSHHWNLTHMCKLQIVLSASCQRVRMYHSISIQIHCSCLTWLVDQWRRFDAFVCVWIRIST